MLTELGARLHSLADIGLYVSVLIGGFIFKWSEIEPHLWMVFIFSYLLMELFSFLKFKKHASLNLHSSKVGGYIQGSFFFLLFAYPFLPWMFTYPWFGMFCPFSRLCFARLC